MIAGKKYKNNGNNQMSFKCDLNKDAKYTLKSGNTYEAKIFTNQGGYILNTDAVKFTTKGTDLQLPHQKYSTTYEQTETSPCLGTRPPAFILLIF